MTLETESAAYEGLRRVSDARELRALAHPVRLNLYEALVLYGPLTATEAGGRIGETPTTCSFHLRQLAKYGFVEEASTGPGRRRAWRVVERGLDIDETPGGSEQALAADELIRLLRERVLRRHEAWRRVQHLEPEWSRLTGITETVAFVTLEELEELADLVVELFRRYEARIPDPALRPEGARAIEMTILSHPIDVPEKS